MFHLKIENGRGITYDRRKTGQGTYVDRIQLPDIVGSTSNIVYQGENINDATFILVMKGNSVKDSHQEDFRALWTSNKILNVEIPVVPKAARPKEPKRGMQLKEAFWRIILPTIDGVYSCWESQKFCLQSRSSAAARETTELQFETVNIISTLGTTPAIYHSTVSAALDTVTTSEIAVTETLTTTDSILDERDAQLVHSAGTSPLGDTFQDTTTSMNFDFDGEIGQLWADLPVFKSVDL